MNASRKPEPFRNPKGILAFLAILCAVVSGLSFWVRLYGEILLVGMEEQIREAVLSASLPLGALFCLLAFWALWAVLGLSWRKGCLVLAFLWGAGAVWGIVYALRSILQPEMPYYLADYLGEEDPYGNVWYGVIPLACGILCLGLGLKARGRRIFLGEAVLFLIAGACALVYHLYMPGERNVMWQWNIYIPLGACICCLLGAFGKRAGQLLMAAQCCFGLLALLGLYQLILSGGRENASCVVLPLAGALGFELARRELRKVLKSAEE